jgi:hypothetical protein
MDFPLSSLNLNSLNPDNVSRFTGGYKAIPPTWMSATGLRPLLLGDPVLLWLQYHGVGHGFAKDSPKHSFLCWIGAKGREFEAAVIRRWAPGAVQVMEEDHDVRTVGTFLKTLAALAQDHEVLTKCALWGGDVFRVYGTADIIAKNTWVYRNWPHLKPDKPEREHYCILDVKLLTELDAVHKRTEFKLASCQVRLYSVILGHLQGFMPLRAFLICRDGVVAVPVKHTLGGGLDPELAALRDWHLDIKLNGANYLPGRDAVVAPGFSNAHDEPWHGAKKIIGRDYISGRPLHWLPRVGDAQAARHPFSGRPAGAGSGSIPVRRNPRTRRGDVRADPGRFGGQSVGTGNAGARRCCPASPKGGTVRGL